MRPHVKLYKLGRISYWRALEAQHMIFDELKRNAVADVRKLCTLDNLDVRRLGSTSAFGDITCPSLVSNSLLLVEHDPVYTIGIRTHQYDRCYKEKLRQSLAQHKLHADFIETNRGGLITFHGPGQLVAYPIINLSEFGSSITRRSVKAYVSLLEKCIIDTLARVGLHGAHTVDKYPGVWLDDGERKVAFIGISCKRFVTMHGISINCDCDLSWFDHIVSCGIEDKAITSVRREFLSIYQNHQKHDTNHKGHLKTSKSSIGHDSQKSQVDFHNQVFKASMSQSQGLNDSPYPNQLDEGTSADLQNPRLFPHSSVDHVGDQFCLSFSKHFQCTLSEEAFPWHMVARKTSPQAIGEVDNSNKL